MNTCLVTHIIKASRKIQGISENAKAQVFQKDPQEGYLIQGEISDFVITQEKSKEKVISFFIIVPNTEAIISLLDNYSILVVTNYNRIFDSKILNIKKEFEMIGNVAVKFRLNPTDETLQ